MSAVYNSTVQGFYLSYYGRPADPAGLTFWTGQLAAAGGNLSSILNAFGTSAEATRRYGTGTTESKIQAVYQQTFGRAADATGLAFYNTEITAGRITLIDMSKRIIDGATGDDVAIRNNRTSAAQSFTDKLVTDAQKAGYSGSGAEDAARSWVTTVTKDAATVTAAVATADATISGLLPQAFSLTTGTDKFTGSAGNDTITGGSNALAATDTLQAADQIDGGAGSDTINLSISKNFSGFTVGTGFLKNVETVNITNGATSTPYSFTARAVSDVTAYNVSGPVNLAGLASTSSAVNYSNISGSSSNRDISVGFDTEAVAGSSDKFAVGLTSIGTAPTSATGAPVGWMNLTTSGVETLTLTATGANYAALATGTSSVKDVVVNGEGSIRFGDDATGGVSSRFTSLDASALKGAVDIQARNATGASSLKGGAGDDTFRIMQDGADADLAGNAAIDGGAGTNTLRISTGGTGGQTTAFKMSNIQTVRLDTIGDPLTFSLGNATTPITKITVSDAAASTSSFAGQGSNAVAIDLAAGLTNNHTVTADTTGAVTAAVLTTSTATASSRATSADSITASKAASLSLSAPSTTTYNGTVTVSEGTTASITLDGDGAMTLFGPALTSLTFKQSSADYSSTLTVGTNATAGSATVSKISSLTLEIANAATAVNSDVGNTPNTFDHFTALNTLNVTTSAPLVANTAAAEFGSTENLAALNAATFAGTVRTAALTVGNIGSSTLAYGVTINSSGLQGKDTAAFGDQTDVGLTVGTVSAGASQAITLNIGGNDGDTVFSNIAIGSADAANGTITVNAVGHGDTSADTLKLGTLAAATVSLDFTGATGAVTTGAITARAVTVKATDSASTVVIGAAAAGTDITTRNSLVFDGPSLGASTVETVIASGSTAFTATLSGGALADTHTFTAAGTTQETITISGNLGVGAANSVKVVSVVTGAPSSSVLGQTVNLSGVVNGTSEIVTGAGRDTITGTAMADTIQGGPGRDTLTGNGGNDTFVLGSATDTGAISGASVTRGTTPGITFVATYTPTGGDVISVSGMDRITDFNLGDKIVTNANATQVAVTASNAVGTAWNGTTDAIYSGSFSSSANTFTFGSAGADSLYVFDGDGGGAGTTYYAIVLVGYVTKLNSGSTGLVGEAT